MTGVLSFGSNLGNRLAHLRAGVELVRQMMPVTAVSSVYETDPVGLQGQQPYLNCIAVVECTDPQAALEAAQRAEELRGRIRADRWGPRPLDVDVVTVDSCISADPRLTLPHPRAAERAFVLVPWAEIDPVAELPGRGSVRALVERLDTSGVRRWSP